MREVVYNVILTAADVAAIVVLARTRRPGVIVLAGAAVGGLAVMLAGPLARHGFEAMRLLAWGVFLHGPVGLAASAVVLGKAHRRVAAVCIAGACLLWAVAADAFLIEPHWLEVSRYEIASPKVTRPIRIVVVSDLQTDHIGKYERNVLRRAMAERPDLLLLPGDYLHMEDPTRRAVERDALRAALREVGFGAPLGVYAVEGNCDTSDWPLIFEGLGVEAHGRTRTIEREGLTITALGMSDSADRGLAVAASPKFHVVFGHYPDFALGEVRADLLVAGHTHGGQVRLPFIGPLLTFSDVPRSWAAGRTELSGGRVLVVSRGIGMERIGAPPLRFLCRPELVVIDVVPAAGPTPPR